MLYREPLVRAHGGRDDDCIIQRQPPKGRRLVQRRQERVRHYEAGIQDGGVMMMVQARCDEDARQIEQQWQALGGRDVFCC
jgi:hypothetical protein